MADHHRVLILALVIAGGLVEANLLYYPELADVQNVLSPLNLCERLCGQCGCLGAFVADDVCQCSCDVRGCDSGYANCTMGMLQVCDESQFDCELPEDQQEYGLRPRDARGHKCLECHEDQHDDHDCDHHGYEDKGCHDGCGDKKFFCCKKHKKHRKKHCKKKHGRKIHIKIKGKLPDCCYFNQHHEEEHHYDDYRAPEQPRIPEEPIPEEIEKPTEAPPIYEPTPEPECDKTPKAKSYSEPEAPSYSEPEAPRRCCQSSSDIHCDNCHIYHGGAGYGQGSYGGGSPSGYSEPAPYAGPPISYGPPVYIPSYSSNYRMPAEVSHPPIQEEPRPAEIKKVQSNKPASFRNYDYGTSDSYSGGGSDSYGGGGGGGHVLEYSHHKVTIPSDHLKPIIEKFLDHPPPSAHPIDLTIYNQVVNQQLYDDVKASSYGTDSFQPPKQPSRDYYEPPTYENSAQVFPPNPPSYAPKNYLPITPPSGAYIPPSYQPQPYYSGPDTGPQVFETSNDPAPVTKPPPPHYLQVSENSYNPYADAVGANYRSAMAASSAPEPSQMQMNSWRAAAARSASSGSGSGGVGCQQGQGRFFNK